MKRSNRLVLLIGIFLALVAFVLIIASMGGGIGGTVTASASSAPTTTKVVVAVADIDLGATITADVVATKDVAIADKPADSYSDTSFVIGQVARMKVTNGQLINSKVINGGGDISTIETPAGFVAMAVQVDQVTGVGTIIKPGDFVDVISGFTADKVPVVLPDPSAAPGTYSYLSVDPGLYNHTTVKVLSQGLQVLGTLLPATAAPADTASPAPDAGTTLNGQQQIVILAVPMQDAEVIKFSQIDGSISLVLRSSKDCTTKPSDGQTYCPVITTTGITLRRLVDDRGVLPPAVVQIIEPTPYPGTVPVQSPKP
ncbi:MAG: Flp pilus assembly protein CpaB [Chloroflexota bacterium]